MKNVLPLKDFNLVMKTENPANKINFQWSIRNIYKLPDLICSSKFSMAAGQPRDWDVSIWREKDDTFEFYLTHRPQREDDATPIQVECYSRILKNDVTVVEKDSQMGHVFRGRTTCPLLSGIKFPKGPEDDKLVFQCFMTAHGYGLVCSRNLYNDDGDHAVDELRSDYLKMMTSGEFADVKIKVGDRSFLAHSCVLKHLAPKFFSVHQEGILKGEIEISDASSEEFLVPKSFSKHQEVMVKTEIISGVSVVVVKPPKTFSKHQEGILNGEFDPKCVSPEVFEGVLQNIYSGEVNQTAIAMNFQQFYCEAVRYELRKLRRESVKELIYSMKTDNVCEIYMLSYLVNDSELTKYILAFINDNLRELETNSHFVTFRKGRPEFPRSIINESDELHFKDDYFKNV